MALYEAESVLSGSEEKESAICKAVNAAKSFWRDIFSSFNRDRHLVVLTSRSD